MMLCPFARLLLGDTERTADPGAVVVVVVVVGFVVVVVAAVVVVVVGFVVVVVAAVVVVVVVLAVVVVVVVEPPLKEIGTGGGGVEPDTPELNLAEITGGDLCSGGRAGIVRRVGARSVSGRVGARSRGSNDTRAYGKRCREISTGVGLVQ